MRCLDLLSPEGESCRQQVLHELQRPEYATTALGLTCLLRAGHFSKHSYLLTNYGESAEATHHIYAYMNRSRRPETELWMFGTWEVDKSDDRTQHEQNDVEITHLLADLIRTINSMDLPESIHAQIGAQTADETDHCGMSRSDYAGHANYSNVMLWGAVHEKTWQRLKRLGLLHPDFTHTELPNHTFLFDLEHLPDMPELPAELQWGEVEAQHLQLVKSRTLIPRQDRTMLELPSVAIFQSGNEMPIAWGFIGPDSSLTTVHVEPEWRGKKLGKRVIYRLLTQRLGKFGGIKIGHGHVSSDNKDSIHLCQSLGGKEAFDVYWLRIALDHDI